MTIYACRSCCVRVRFEIRPHRCGYCLDMFGFDEEWTAHDQQLARAIIAWNEREVLTGKFRPEQRDA